MKKIILPVAAALLAVALIYSCSKETTPITERFTTTEESDVRTLIFNFIDRMEARNEGLPFKSEESISIDSAIWYIDATLNYQYSFAGHPFQRKQHDTVFAKLFTAGPGEVSLEDMYACYDTVYHLVRQKYKDIQEQDKHLIQISLQNVGYNELEKTVYLRIRLTTGFGTLSSFPVFDDGNSYHYSHEADWDCNGMPNPGAPVIFDAMLYSHFTTPPPGCNFVFVLPEQEVTFYYYDYPHRHEPINYLDYSIFFASSAVGEITDVTKCLEYNQWGSEVHEMSFYYHWIEAIIEDWQNSSNNELGLSFEESTITSFDDWDDNINIIGHVPKVIFRKKQIFCDKDESDPWPVPIDL